jgi:hypothetical protein
MSTVEELQAEVARLKSIIGNGLGPLISIPAPSKRSLRDTLLELEDSKQIPASLRLLQVAMTQRAAMTNRFKAAKAQEALLAAQKVYHTLKEKQVYSSDIMAAKAKVESYKQDVVKFTARSNSLQLQFDAQRNATQEIVWPEIVVNITNYSKATKATITNTTVAPTLNAFVQLFETITSGAKFQTGSCNQLVPDGMDSTTLEYFIQLYKQAQFVKERLKTLGEEIAERAGGEANGVSFELGPLKTPDRCMEKTMEHYDSRFECLADIARGSVKCTSLSSCCYVLKVLLALQKEGQIELVRGKNRFRPDFDADGNGGYRDALLNVVLNLPKNRGGGHICELQVHLADFLKIKHSGGHSSYKVARSLHLADPDLLTYRGQMTPEVGNGIAKGMVQILILDYMNDISNGDSLQMLEQALGKSTCLLHTLSVRSCHCNDGGAAHLAKALSLNPLERLIVAGDNKQRCAVTFKGAQALIQSTGSVLSLLDLSYTNLGIGIDFLLQCIQKNCPHLGKLDARACGLTGPLPTDVSQWPEGLNVLNVQENPIVGVLSDSLAKLPYLNELNVAFTRLEGEMSDLFAATLNLKLIDVTGKSRVI